MAGGLGWNRNSTDTSLLSVEPGDPWLFHDSLKVLDLWQKLALHGWVKGQFSDPPI